MDTPARQYARIRYRLLLSELVGWIGFLIAFQGCGWSQALVSLLAVWASVEWARIAGYVAIFGAAAYLVFLPLHWYGSFVLEHRFRLSRLTIRGWWIREGKRVLLSALLWIVLIEGWYAILNAAPLSWTLWATIGWVGVSIVLARVFPTILLPMFYKTVPLADRALSQRLLALCERVGLPALGAFRVALGVETRKANAALAGLGKTRRVLLSDTLLERFSPEEIETVLAHELGHQRHRHITKLLILTAVGSWVALSLIAITSAWWIARLQLSGLSDLVGFPMLALSLMLIGLIGLPLQNAISRAFEWEADRFAVTVTQAPTVFANALRKLGELNLADPAPPRWVEWLLYDHPPIAKRILAAEGGRSVQAVDGGERKD